MSQVWHLFRNDLRASGPILAVWGTALVGCLAFGWRDPLTANFKASSSGLGAFFPLATAVAAGIIVQKDGLVGVRAFWKTRPISRWILLAEKAAFVSVVLAGAQAAVFAALLLRFNVPKAALPDLLEGALAIWFAELLVAMALATLTAGTAQLIASALLVIVATLWVASNVGEWVNGARYDWSFFGPAIVTLACIVIALRYGGWSRWKTTATATIGWAALVLLPLTGWLQSAGPVRAAAPTPAPAGLSVKARLVNPGDAGFPASFHNNGSVRSEGFSMRWAAEGLATHQILRLDFLEARVVWDDGQVNRVEGALLGRLRAEQPSSPAIVTFRDLEDPRAVLTKRGRLEGQLTGQLQTVEEWGSTPLVPFAEIHGPGYALRIESVSTEGNKTTMLIRERRVNPSDAADWPEILVTPGDDSSRREAPQSISGSSYYHSSWPPMAVREREMKVSGSKPERLVVQGYAAGENIAMDVAISDFRIMAE